MSFSTDTLQDFVMGLINDESAKAAYLADPTAALADAGLADLTPADVAEVLPLVADSLPAGLPTDLGGASVSGEASASGEMSTDGPPMDGAAPAEVPGLDSLPGLDALPLGALPAVPGLDSLPGLDALPLGALPAVPGLDSLPGLDALPAVPGLDALPALPGLDALPLDLPAGVPGLDSLPVAVPAVGDLPVAVPGLDNLPVDVPNLPTLETPLGDVTALVGDASAKLDLDGDALSTATSGYLSNPENGDAPTVSNYTSTALGDFAAGAKLDPSEFGGSIAGTTDLADAGLGLVGHDNGSLGAWGGVDTVAGDLAGGLRVGPDGGALAAESPLGNIHVTSDGDFSIEPANPADLLDVDQLGDTGDAVAGTVAHVVSTGADTVADGVESGSDDLAGYLMTGPVAPVAGVVESGVDTVTEGISQGGDTVSEHLTAIPTVDALPLEQLPELPALPDLPAIDSDDLPALPDATSALPVDLPSLPVDLPDTGAVTGLVTDNAVTDAVQQSPVGGLLDGVTGHLPQVADLPGDLDLGL